MRHSAEVVLAATPERVFERVEDLAGYPDWLTLIRTVTPEGPAGELAGDAIVERAWIVELEARIGPMSRSKRLRMIRRRHEPSHRVTFVRAELDGRQHAAWDLDVTLAPVAGGTGLTMELHYDGRLWVAPLGRILDAEIAAARTRLAALLKD